MTLWNPSLWDDFGTVGIAVFVAVMIVVGVTRGWLVPRPLHREIIDGKNAALTELRERAKVDAETIRLQAQTIADRNAVEDTSIRMLQAFREATTGSGEG